MKLKYELEFKNAQKLKNILLKIITILYILLYNNFNNNLLFKKYKNFS